MHKSWKINSRLVDDLFDHDSGAEPPSRGKVVVIVQIRLSLATV